MADYAAERAAALRRQEERKERDLYPRLLLGEAEPGAEPERLTEVATEKWPGMEAEKRRRIVANAVAIRDEGKAGSRRIDPAEVDELRHPSEREAGMAAGTENGVVKLGPGRRMTAEERRRVERVGVEIVQEHPDIEADAFADLIAERAGIRMSVGTADGYMARARTAAREQADSGDGADGGDPGDSNSRESAPAEAATSEPPADPPAREAEPDQGQATERVGGEVERTHYTIDLAEINQVACKRFECALSRAQTSAIASYVRRQLSETGAAPAAEPEPDAPDEETGDELTVGEERAAETVAAPEGRADVLRVEWAGGEAVIQRGDDADQVVIRATFGKPNGAAILRAVLAEVA